MADVEQMKKAVPFVTCEIAFCQMFGVDVSNLNFWVQIDPVKQPIQATLWVLDTCLMVGLLPLIIILITASLSSKTQNTALEPEDFPFDET